MRVSVTDRTREFSLNVVNEIQRAVYLSAVAVEGGAIDRVAVDTGALKGSIRKEHHGNIAEVSANTSYAMRIEYGGSQQCPNGYMLPSLKANKNSIIGYLREALQRVVRRI